jgi:hypothetical protein
MEPSALKEAKAKSVSYVQELMVDPTAKTRPSGRRTAPAMAAAAPSAGATATPSPPPNEPSGVPSGLKRARAKRAAELSTPRKASHVPATRIFPSGWRITVLA